MSKKPGYIYILTNPSINGQVKIGRTERHPEDRRKEISAATGVSTSFELVYWKFFEDCHEAEFTLHKRLEQEGFRVSNNKEFFKISEDNAKKIIDDLSDEVSQSNQDTNKIIKEGIKWLYGNEGTLRNEKRALDYFEQAASLGSHIGSYWAGIACERISITIKRKTEQSSWQQRALNHYQQATKKEYYKAYARSSWLYRKFNQHNEANIAWDIFLSGVAKKENIDNETAKWIIKWADNIGAKNKKLPDSTIWNIHGKKLISLCNKNNSPNGLAKKVIKDKIKSKSKIIFTIISIPILIAFYYFYSKYYQ